MSCLILPKTTLCTPSWKNVKPHHRDSNQGPSAYRVDALWRSSHPQRHQHDISPTCLHILRSTGISHHSSGPSATTICQAKKIIISNRFFLCMHPSRILPLTAQAEHTLGVVPSLFALLTGLSVQALSRGSALAVRIVRCSLLTGSPV